MDVFEFRDRIVADYERFTRSFTKIAAPDIRAFLQAKYAEQHYWPAPLIQLNPSFVRGKTVEALVSDGVLDPECARIFRLGKKSGGAGETLGLHRHQEEAVHIARSGKSYVLTTGTGSGKSLSYFIPIVDSVLRAKKSDPKRTPSISAVVIYPMNALCNSQMDELGRFLKDGYSDTGEPVRFARYTGQESQGERDEIARQPPDILLTNYMMLELILTRQNDTDKAVVRAARGLRFLVLDELHTYRGRQGADVALLVRRVREALNRDVQSVGTSATMVSEGNAGDRRRVVAEVASRLFGTSVDPANIITETLQRVTSGEGQPSAEALRAAVGRGVPENSSFEELQRHPISVWVELNLGLDREEDKWVRTRAPMNLMQAARKLASDSGVDESGCAAFLRGFLLLAYGTRDKSGRSLFAFRLHQFVAGGGDVFGTLEPEGSRYLTLEGQTYQPGANREKLLFNLCFCRECGQEYAPVWASGGKRTVESIQPRELSDRSHEDDDVRFGFFMPDPTGRFDPDNVEESLPEDWLQYDDKGVKLKPAYRKIVPIGLHVSSLGASDAGGMAGWLIPGSFRFCLNPECDAYYDGSVRSDLTKLAGLSTEGRSSATTVLTLAALRYLLEDSTTLSDRAKKLLGFTDNRQDASLQAGHFNDFVQVLLLRGALLAAIEDSPDKSLIDETLTQKVFDHLHLADTDFSANPGQKGIAADNTRRALRDVLGYRLYFDLRRGWRITNPNLEQLGLLTIDYLSLDECCADPDVWSGAPDLLVNAKPETRKRAARLVLETLRRQLCVKTRYLDPLEQEQIKNRSHNNLREPWGLTEDEQLKPAHALIPESVPRNWRGEFPAVFASFRSRLGRMLRQGKLWGQENPDLPKRFTPEHYDTLIRHILGALQRYGIVESVEVSGLGKGYRVNSAALRWSLPDENVERVETAGLRVTDNAFFKTLYRNVAGALRADSRFLHRLEAREHTAQVDSDVREEREARFRAAALPVLFCSPTMELGVDIAELNTVYMRNLPPTPANYAQRSGRAGRSGQPALVVSYAAAKSPYDQYFFRNPIRMVAGAVNPPSLDLANEDLIRSHLHAVWLAETGRKLGTSVSEVLDLAKEDELPILDVIETEMNGAAVRERSITRARAIMGMLEGELPPEVAPWYGPDWLERVANTAFRHFDDAFERWRTLFRATSQQMLRAQKIMNSAASSPKERDEAKRRHDDAFIQRKLLLDARSTMNSDFYTYRYLASQGFLPGYNFPRLPLLAFIPARREKVSRDSFLSRPRFLALSEFGPRSIIYHEGSQYRVTKAILTVTEQDLVTVEAKLPVREARLCPSCGYGHFGAQVDAERCASCDAMLEGGDHLKTLYRIENVSTRRVERITSDEEERQRQGFETLTTLQFAEKDGVLQANRIVFSADEVDLLEAQYGPAATVWRINLGWRRRKEKSIHGFNIDVTTGLWAKDAQAPDDASNGEGDTKAPPQRIIPFVEDRRNVLIVRPRKVLDPASMATLQYALKRGIEREFQLEESELMVEPLPSYDERNAILLYEAAEGGAGVLTRLASDPEAIRRIAARALDVCHFSRSGESWVTEELTDTDRSCEAGCYRCLLSYYNQPDHIVIDRKNLEVKQLLCRLIHAEAEKGSEGRSAEDQFEELWRMSGSGLERTWLTWMKERRHHLPDRAQRLIEEHGTRPDFAYSKAQALIYVDGPHHDGDAQKNLDVKITERLEDAGYTVIRFGLEQSAWPKVIAAYPDIFGKGSPS